MFHRCARTAKTGEKEEGEADRYDHNYYYVESEEEEEEEKKSTDNKTDLGWSRTAAHDLYRGAENALLNGQWSEMYLLAIRTDQK